MRAQAQSGRWEGAIVTAGGAIGAAALGLLAAEASRILDPPTGAIVAASFVVLAGTVAAGPVACVGGLVAFVLSGWNPVVWTAGPVDLRGADLFYVALAGWAFARLVGGVRRSRATVGLGRGALLIFLVVVAGSVIHVAAIDREALPTSALSFVRLAQTASLVWLIPIVVVTPTQVRVIVRIAIVSGAVAVAAALALAQGGLEGFATTRQGGFLGINALGLMSALMVVAAASGSVPAHPAMRVAVGATGLLGMLLSRSIGGLIAGVVGIGMLVAIRRVRGGGSGLGRVARGFALTIAGGSVALVAVALLRPDSLPWSPGFSGSSTYHRVVLSAAAWETFAREPLTGVGWQRSDDPDVLASTVAGASLRGRFEDANPVFFPDVNPTSAHNAYLQLLAELGVIGFVAFAFVVFRVGSGARAVIRRWAGDRPTADLAVLLGVELLVVAVWWNENALFGGQAESVTAALFLGALVSLARAPVPGPSPVQGTPAPDALPSEVGHR